MLTKKVEYGYMILRKLYGSNETNLMSGKEILESIDVPYSMGLSILTQLSKNGLIESFKGKTGGFCLKKRKITMLELFLAMEKDLFDNAINKNFIDLNYRDITLKIGNFLLMELEKVNVIPLVEWHYLKYLIH